MRWARQLLATGRARAQEIAICAASTDEWDDYMLTLAKGASLPIHLSSGLPALSTGEGQACAALADVLLNGLSQDRVRRLFDQADNARERKLPVDLLHQSRIEAELSATSCCAIEPALYYLRTTTSAPVVDVWPGSLALPQVAAGGDDIARQQPSAHSARGGGHRHADGVEFWNARGKIRVACQPIHPQNFGWVASRVTQVSSGEGMQRVQ